MRAQLPTRLLMIAAFTSGFMAFSACDDEGEEHQSADAGGTSDGGGADATLTPPPFSFAQGDTAIAQSGSFHIPGNERTSTTEPWQDAAEKFTLNNDSGGKITITSVTVEPDVGTVAEEFTLETGATDGTALDVNDVGVDAGGKLEFSVRFRPVVGGERSARINVVWDDSKLFQFTVKGKGAGASNFWPLKQADAEWLVGSPQQDELLSAMVADTEGNVFYSANVIGLADGFNYDVLIGRVDADGKAGWQKVFNGPNRDFAADAGGNNDTGGTAGCLDWDGGAVYFAGATSVSSTNVKYRALALKIDAKTGDLAWQQAWEPVKDEKPATNSALAYAVDARGADVLVTGKTKGGVLVAALSKATGAVRWTRALALGGTDEAGWAIRTDGKGGAWIGADSEGKAIVARITGLDKEPKLESAQTVSFGDKVRINHIAVDAAGNAYLALGPKGLSGRFGAARVNADGKLVWSKTFPAASGSSGDTHAVAVAGDWLYVGGRIGLADYDTDKGDGLLLKLGIADGEPAWSAFYYSGPGAERLAEHRIKGVAVVGERLFIAQQVFTGDKNARRYTGYAYLAPGKAEDGKAALADLGGADLAKNEGGNAEVASGFGAWDDAPELLVVQPAADKTDGEAPDADVLISRVGL